MKRIVLVITVLVGLTVAAPAFALDLHQARSSGQIGEKNDGYVTALKPGADVNALVADVNAKRQKEYAGISAQNKQSVDVVAKLAVGQIVQGLEPGAQYQDASGAWKTR